MAREGTTLTLEEFYSPTPLSSVRPHNLRRPSKPEKQEVPPKQDNPEDKEVVMAEEMQEEEVKVEITAEVVPETKVKPSMPKTTIASRKFHTPPPRNSYMPRSKTMDTIPKKTSSKGGMPKVYDMSAMSAGGDAGGGIRGNFVIDKHVAIHSKKNSPSSSPSSSVSSKRGQGTAAQAVSTVSLMSTSSEQFPAVTDAATNSMPAPKMSRAHTLYGQMGSRGKGSAGKGAPFSPPVVHAVAPAVSMVYKTKQPKTQQVKVTDGNSLNMTKAAVPSLSELKQQPRPKIETKSPGGSAGVSSRPLGSVSSQRRPVFSSAASWRQRSEADDVLLKAGKSAGSPKERRLSDKDS